MIGRVLDRGPRVPYYQLMPAATTNAATETKAAALLANPIVKIMADRYGAGPILGCATVVEWAALHYAEHAGAPAAKAALRKLNKARERLGAMPCYVPYGSPLF